MTPPISKNAGPGAARILAAYESAEKAKVLFVHKAVICGQMLREQRQDMIPCHRGKGWNDHTKEESAKFNVWLHNHCPHFAERTAYRWMAAASRVMANLLEIHNPNSPIEMELDGETFFISTILTMPEGDCTEAMRTFQTTFNTFLADKTLADASACALMGTDDDSRIARAANGQDNEGAWQKNRRDYSRFLACHLKEMTQSIDRWDNFIKKNPVEHAKMTEAIRAAVLGGKYKVKDSGRPVDFKGWPKSFSDLMIGVLRERLRTISQES